MYFLKQLKKSGASTRDLIMYYTAIIRSALEYACQAWHGGIMKTQSDSLENQQKRALKIVLPVKPYDQAREEVGLDTLENRRDNLCRKFYHDMCNNEHKLHHLLPGKKRTDMKSPLLNRDKCLIPRQNGGRETLSYTHCYELSIVNIEL